MTSTGDTPWLLHAPWWKQPSTSANGKPSTHHRRLRIEPVNSSVKRCRIVKDRIRLWKEGVPDLVMDICWALHTFRVRLTPRRPMV